MDAQTALAWCSWITSHMANPRLAQEIKSLANSIKNGALVGLSNLEVVEDDLFVWRLHISAAAFDLDTPQARRLRADLLHIAEAYGHPNAVVMEAR